VAGGTGLWRTSGGNKSRKHLLWELLMSEEGTRLRGKRYQYWMGDDNYAVDCLLKEDSRPTILKEKLREGGFMKRGSYL